MKKYIWIIFPLPISLFGCFSAVFLFFGRFVSMRTFPVFAPCSLALGAFLLLLFIATVILNGYVLLKSDYAIREKLLIETVITFVLVLVFFGPALDLAEYFYNI